jgi:putative tricarboxylic transport membrane protein
VQGQPFDLFLLLALGLLGFAMRRFGLPVLPLIVGAILGPLFEKHLRRSLQTSGGEVSGLLGGPVSWVCYGIVIVVLLWPLVARLRRLIDRGADGTGGAGRGGEADGPGRPDGPHGLDAHTTPDAGDRELHDSTSGSSSPAPTRKEPES